MTEREKLLSFEPVIPLFFKFSIPAITGMLVQALYNIVDRYYISNIPEIGSIAISGVGVTMPFTFLLMGFTMLFAFGGGANISLRLGENRKDKADHILGNVIVMLAIMAVVLNLVFFSDLDFFLRLFGATDSNIGYARSYIWIILIGNLWNTFAFGLNAIIRSEGAPRWSMLMMITGAVANTILDPIFIYETIPILNIPGLGMGVAGAAWATVIAQGLSLILGIWYYASGKSLLKLSRKNLKLNWSIIKMVMAIGVSPFFIQIAGSLVAAIFNNSLRHYGGDLAIGAYVIINSISTIFYMPTFGMNQGSQPIIGFNYGAKNYIRVKRAVLVGIVAASSVTILGWLLIMLMPDTLVTPMTPGDLDLRALTVTGIRRMEAMMFLVGFQVIASNFFSSIGKARLSFFLSLTRQVFFLIPTLLILPRYMGLDGIWYAMPVSDIGAFLVSLVFLLRELRILDREISLQENQVA